VLRLSDGLGVDRDGVEQFGGTILVDLVDATDARPTQALEDPLRSDTPVLRGRNELSALGNALNVLHEGSSYALPSALLAHA